MKASVFATLLAFFERIHAKTFAGFVSGTFLTAAFAYLVLHIDPKAPLSFAVLGAQIEGATVAGLLATGPVVAALLTNIYKPKQTGTDTRADAVTPSDYGVEHDPLDTAIPPK